MSLRVFDTVSPTTIAASLAQFKQQMKGEIDDGTIFWLAFTAGVGKFEESRAQAVTAKTYRLRRGISNPHQPRYATAAPKKHP
jgi:hypothetical protein